jgi:hypothetical protein
LRTLSSLFLEKRRRRRSLSTALKRK